MVVGCINLLRRTPRAHTLGAAVLEKTDAITVIKSQEESDDSDSDPYEDVPDTGRHRMHWSTPRMPEFKRVLNASKYDALESAKLERQEEAMEAFKVGSRNQRPSLSDPCPRHSWPTFFVRSVLMLYLRKSLNECDACF